MSEEPPKDGRDDGQKRMNKPQVPNGGMKFGKGVAGWIMFAVLVIVGYLYYNGPRATNGTLSITDFFSELDKNNVRELTMSTDDISGSLKEKFSPGDNKPSFDKFRVTLPYMATSDGSLLHQLTYTKDGVVRPYKLNADNPNNMFINMLVPVIPWLLLIVIIWFIFIRQLRNSGGAGGMLGNFGRSRHKVTSKEHTHITFDDVAGVEEAKDEVKEIVEFLRNPKKFQRLGGRIPRGVLLVGEPGTGKTLLAKAIAGEADVPFFSISGSDFVEMFVGVGASRVRDLFKQAKDNSPCIIFLDEIDAVGRRRGSGFSSGGHDEREQTLNAILVEMDGFESNDQVIVVASTNRVDVLDPALTRPGRFDRQVYVPLPDVKGRLEILKVHSRKVKLGPNADLARLARATPGFSGADLAAIINEAALAATLANKDYIEQDDMEEARDKVRFGRANRSRAMDEKEKLATAYHEAGHAVVQWLLRPDADPLHKVTIIPRGKSLGSTMTLPEKDRYSYSKRWCDAFVKMTFGGRIAELMFTGDVNTGVASDIRQATSIVRRMITEWGMNERIGFVFLGEDENKPNMLGGFGDGREYSQETAKIIDEEVKKTIDVFYEETRQLLEANRDKIELLAKALMQYETLDNSEVERVMRGDALTRPTVSDMIKEQQRRDVIQSPPEPNTGLGGLGSGPLPQPG